MKKLCNNVRKPVIDKIFDASTGHITKKDSELLLNNKKYGLYPLIVYTYPEGFFVYALLDSENLIATRNFGFSRELINLIKIAKKNKCKFLCLDADGTTYKELPIFDW